MGEQALISVLEGRHSLVRARARATGRQALACAHTDLTHMSTRTLCRKRSPSRGLAGTSKGGGGAIDLKSAFKSTPKTTLKIDAEVDFEMT